MRLTGPAQTGRAAVVAVALLAVSGCGAIKTAAIKSVRLHALHRQAVHVFHAEQRRPFARRDAVLFGLNTFELLLETVPRYVPSRPRRRAENFHAVRRRLRGGRR